MQTSAGPSGSRLDKRKARTRSALITAAQGFLAQQNDVGTVSIQELTDAADVGFGTFYNHFRNKTELFHEAIEETFEQLGANLDALLVGVEDPVVVFSHSLRLTGRLRESHRQMADIVIHAGPALLTSERGLAPRGRRDLAACKASGRFDFDDVDIAMVTVAGALLGVLHLADVRPGLDVARAVDQMTLNVLRMFGVSKSDAVALVALPLPVPATR
ncbi:TetR/AcrR family transcriptional regulator [soil metagenome]|jgi:AcrR family transcriptional regulator